MSSFAQFQTSPKIPKKGKKSTAPKLVTAFRYLIYKHSPFLRHRVIRALPSATVLCTVLVIITLETVLKEKVAIILQGDPIILATTKSVSINEI